MTRPNRSLAARFSALAGLCGLLVLLSACAMVLSPPQPRGHRIDEELLKELVPGTATKADVIALLGSPTKRATFDDNVWIYIASVTRLRIAQRPALDSQDVTVLTFNEKGTLQSIEQLTQNDAVAVDVVERVTPTPGSERTWMQQLLGNVGRLNPAPNMGRSRGSIGGGS